MTLLISGPVNGLHDLRRIAGSLAESRPDGIIAFGGFLRQHCRQLAQVPTILNITASTLLSEHTRKRAVGTVAEAIALGADAVAVHVNVTSASESDMLVTLGRTAKECDTSGVPLLAIMYPRGERPEGEDNYEELRASNPDEYAKLVAHACRIGLELGADIIKTQYTGTATSFRRVVEACSPLPVVVAGGPVAPARQIFEVASAALSAGAAGVSYGRNVFSRAVPERWIDALRMLVHDGATPEAAAAYVER